MTCNPTQRLGIGTDTSLVAADGRWTAVPRTRREARVSKVKENWLAGIDEDIRSLKESEK